MKQHVTHETASEYWADGLVHLAGVISSLIAAWLLASNALKQRFTTYQPVTAGLLLRANRNFCLFSSLQYGNIASA